MKMDFFKKQTREEQLKEIANNVSTKLIDGSYTPEELVYLVDTIKYKASSHMARELRKNVVREHRLKKQCAQLKEAINKIDL